MKNININSFSVAKQYSYFIFGGFRFRMQARLSALLTSWFYRILQRK